MSQRSVWSILFFGSSIMVASMILGYAVTESVTLFRLTDRCVTVRGLAERKVIADYATLNFQFRVEAETSEKALAQLEQSMQVVSEYVKAQGFSAAELRVSDVNQSKKRHGHFLQTEALANNKEPNVVAKSVLVVESANVSAVQALTAKKLEILKISPLLEDMEVQYEYKKTFAELRPAMMEEAMENARLMGEKIANLAQSRLGKIKKAHQGQFEITGVGVNSDWYNPNALKKNVRVVTTVTFWLREGV